MIRMSEKKNEIAKISFCDFFFLQVTNKKRSAEIASQIQDPLLQHLATAVSFGSVVLQSHLLELLKVVVSLQPVSEK